MLERLLSGGGGESRAMSFQSMWGAGLDWNTATWSGSRISYDNAFMVSATYGCVRLIADTISTFPANTYVRRDGERYEYPRPDWVVEPDTNTTMADHLQQVLVSMLLSHGACVRVYRNAGGEVVALVPLNPQLVEPRRNQFGEVEYVWHDGLAVIPASDMIYIPALRKPGQVKGIDPISELKQVFGSASAIEEFAARFFSNGSNVGGIIELPQTISKDQAATVKEVFEDGHRGNRKSHRVGVIGGGGKFVKTTVDPNEAQMIESRRFMVEEIARVYRVPLHMLQVAAPGVQSYASNEENALQFASYTLRPLVAKIEAAYSKLLPGEAFLRLNMDAILRGDLTTRFAAYSSAIQAGYMTINDARRLEDMKPIDGGDVLRVSLANVNIAAADLVETDRKTMMASRLILAGFDPKQTLESLELPDIAHTGVPSTQLQPVSSIDPEDPTAVYNVEN